MNIKKNNTLRVSVLSEALPYIQKFAGRTIVIKYGGAAMVNDELKKAVFRDIALLSSVGVKLVIVHGGGPEINHWLDQLNIEPKFKNGLRVTDNKTMDIVEMVLVGRVNKQIVKGLNTLGASSIGLCGIDANLFRTKTYGDGSYGLVGSISEINTEILKPLLENGYIPIISSVAQGEDGNSHNINADTVAGKLATSLKAEKLILLTDIPGVLKNKNDDKSLIKHLTIKEANDLITQNIVDEGMTPKTNCCIDAIKNGVKAAHIIDGRVSHALLLEIFTNEGIGTMFT